MSRLTPVRSSLTPVAVVLAIVCCLLWSGAYVTGKLAIGTDALPGFGPYRAAFFRFAIAGLLLGLWGFLRDPKAFVVRREDVPAFLRLALFGMGLTYVFNYAGLALSTGTAAALLMSTEPVWIAVLAVLFLKERLTKPRLFGVLAGFAGAILVVLSTQKPEVGAKTHPLLGPAMLGNVLIILSLLFESGAVLTVKRLTSRYKGVVCLTYEFLIGSLMLCPFAIWETVQQGPLTGNHAPTTGAWWSFLYLVTGCTLVAYTVWFKLLEKADASDITVFIFLQPVVGTLIGVFAQGDTFTFQTSIGAALVFAGVWGITAASKKPGSS